MSKSNFTIEQESIFTTLKEYAEKHNSDLLRISQNSQNTIKAITGEDISVLLSTFTVVEDLLNWDDELSGWSAMCVQMIAGYAVMEQQSEDIQPSELENIKMATLRINGLIAFLTNAKPLISKFKNSIIQKH